MKFIPKQDAFYATQFTSLESLNDVMGLIKGNDSLPVGTVTLDLKGWEFSATIALEQGVVTINRDDWIMRKGDQVVVLTDNDIKNHYERR